MFHLPKNPFEDHEPTLKDVMILLFNIDHTLDGIFCLLHDRGEGGHPGFFEDDGPIPSMFTAVAFLDHEERIEKLEAMFKKD